MHKSDYNPALGDRDEFVKKNQGLVWMVVHKTIKKYKQPLDKDDLFQEGVLGLMRAYKSYDPAKGSMSTHAALNIKSKLMCYIRDKASVVKPHRETYEIVGKIIKQKIEQLSVKELSEILNVSEEKIIVALQHMESPHAKSLNMTINESDDTDGLDMLPYYVDFEIAEINEFTSTLDARSQEALNLRLKGLVQKEIAEIMGISQVGAGRILRRIGEKFKEYQGGSAV